VDNRGSGEEEIYNLLSKKHLAVEHTHLDSGDIIFGSIGIERKTVSDLVNSVTGNNRHLWEQLKILKDTYDTPILLIEGPINYKDKLLTGILFAILLKWKIPYINTYNIYDSAEAIHRMFIKSGQNITKSYPPAVVKKEVTVDRIRWAMIQCVRNIGPTLAKEILNKVEFNSICNSNPKELSKSIKGLGLKTATKLIEVFK